MNFNYFFFAAFFAAFLCGRLFRSCFLYCLFCSHRCDSPNVHIMKRNAERYTIKVEKCFGACPLHRTRAVVQTESVKKIQLITDGACLGNPGRGGWAAILRYGANKKEIYGCEPHTTNNRMELTAAIEGLRTLKEKCEVEIITDSEY